MKLLPLALAAALLANGTAQAGGIEVCDMDSDYSLRIDAQGLLFHRESGDPKQVEMQQGRLRVDGRELALSPADRDRVARYEREVRALVPEVKAIALDAVGLAGEAVMQVATTFAGDNSSKAMDRIEHLSRDLADRIVASNDTADWGNDEFEEAIESLVGELVPMLVGDVAAVAIQVALSGDEKAAEEMEARAERMEKAIEEGVERRADELETRAEALCPKFEELDALESALEVRLVGNQPLDLLRVD